MAGQEELFALALGIEEPIYVEAVEFDKDKGELHIRINFRRGARFACSSCGKTHLPVHDTVEKTWRHLNFFQYKCFIHLRTPRTKCPDCGDRLYMPPWGIKSSGFTMLFELPMLTLAKAMPVSQIAALIGKHDTKVWRVIRSYVGKAHTEKRFEATPKVGIDETSTHKGHNYVALQT